MSPGANSISSVTGDAEPMHSLAGILHLDLDAFFASVEQRDKPSLRGKPVVVGGIGVRGVVATASYEARRFGVRSAMSTAEARRLAPHAAYLSGRFEVYRESSRVVMGLLREISPVIEPLSLDEAYVDLQAGSISDFSTVALADLASEIRREVTRRTEGLSASVGIGSSKLIAKLASEAAKPGGQQVVAVGSEAEMIASLPVRVIPGVGPATMDRLSTLGVRTVADLREVPVRELARELGQAVGTSLHELAFARDDRPVNASRETKSISVEDTFQVDLTDPAEIAAVIDQDAEQVVARLRKAGFFARTITLKVRSADFVTWTRSRTLEGATDDLERVRAVAHGLWHGLTVIGGVRLLGVGVSNFTVAAQEELFWDESEPQAGDHSVASFPAMKTRHGLAGSWAPGMDVVHADHGRGWVWGAGAGVVTVRFEARGTPVGPVKSFRADDPALSRAEPLALQSALSEQSSD